MQSFFLWLASNPYVLLFAVALGAVLLARVSVRGLGLGVVGSAIVLGAAISTVSALLGVKLDLDGVARSIFYCLFVFALGLRVGPSLLRSLHADDVKLAALAALCAVLGLALTVGLVKLWNLPPGAAGGILAGALTASAAVGVAEEAVRQGAVTLPPGTTLRDVTGMIALSYGLTYLWGTLAIVLVCKYLPAWWGIDSRMAAKAREHELGVPNVDDAGLTGYRPHAIRAYRLTNDALTGWNVRQFTQKYPSYTVLNVLRPEPARQAAESQPAKAFALEGAPSLATAGMKNLTVLRGPEVPAPPLAVKAERGVLPPTQYAKLGAPEHLAFRQGDIVTIGAPIDHHAQGASLFGPEVDDEHALNIPLDTGSVLVTRKDVEGREFADLRDGEFARQMAIHRVERGGVPIPLGLHVKLQRGDVLLVSGVKSAVERLAAMTGRLVQPSASTDLVTIVAGMLLGLAIGSLEVNAFGGRMGLGYAGGLLVSGLLVSALASRLDLPGYGPSPARDFLEELGLVVFVAIVAIQAGTALVTQLTAELATGILIAGFVVGTLPPVVAWAVGLHAMKINPAILQGAIAGGRSHPRAARVAARDAGSHVPWIGFPVAYAVSVLLVTVFGYVAMVLAR